MLTISDMTMNPQNHCFEHKKDTFLLNILQIVLSFTGDRKKDIVDHCVVILPQHADYHFLCPERPNHNVCKFAIFSLTS